MFCPVAFVGFYVSGSRPGKGTPPYTDAGGQTLPALSGTISESDEKRKMRKRAVSCHARGKSGRHGFSVRWVLHWKDSLTSLSLNES